MVPGTAIIKKSVIFVKRNNVDLVLSGRDVLDEDGEFNCSAATLSLGRESNGLFFFFLVEIQKLAS